MKTLEEIIATVAPDTMREALVDRRGVFRKALAESAAAYAIENANPNLSDKAKAKALADIERDIRKWDWAIREIDRRLEESAAALTGEPAEEG